MKTKISLFFLLFSGFFLNRANALYVVTVSYHNSCFIGCGEVRTSKVPATITLVSGRQVDFWAESIHCEGMWVKSCPKTHAGFRLESQVPEDQLTWVENKSLEMWEYAVQEIDNGDLMGVHEVLVYNQDISSLVKFRVTWNKFQNGSGDWEEYIEVGIDNDVELPSTEG